MKHVILLIDNQPEDLETWTRILKNAGYDIRTAQNSQKAQNILQATRIDLAVIDLRLTDDNDENDLSGLILAKDTAYHHIPKIILTAFDAGYSDLREMLGPVVDKLPPTVAFVKKDERPQVLLEVIRQTLELWPRLRTAITKVSEQIKSDHLEARRQAYLNYRAAFGLSVLGSIFIFSGIGLAWFGQLAIGLVGIAGGIAVQVMTNLFLGPAKLANQRMDIYHRELLETYRFEFLLSSAYELPLEKRVASIERLINKAIDSWISLPTNPASPAVIADTKKEST